MSEHTLVVSVFKTILKRKLLPESATVVVGVSGGTDSLALLHILTALRDRLSLRLHVATLDHGLRGEAGAADAQFVIETARSWGLEATAGYADVRALADQHHLGIEAAARLARYEFLASLADQYAATHVAVAHNADDQVETVLFHILRGSGLTGLGGMAYASPLIGRPDLTLIRPLLDIPRADLEAYCREHGLQPRHDATNDDTIYTRNRLRRQIVPYLREISPQIERNLRQLADIARVEDDFVDAALHQAIDSQVTRGAGSISVPRSLFTALHSALQRRFILWAARSLADPDDLAYIHVEAAVDLALRGEVGSIAQLTSRIQLRLDYETVVVELDVNSINLDLPLLEHDLVIPVAVPGVMLINANWSLMVAMSPLSDQAGWLDVREESKIILRARKRGDRFAPFGLGGHTQKLSKWMIDHKVPVRVRDRLPLIVVDDQVAAFWWKGWAVSEHFAVTSASKRVLFVFLTKNFQNS